jgi:hypothetical protein
MTDKTIEAKVGTKLEVEAPYFERGVFDYLTLEDGSKYWKRESSEIFRYIVAAAGDRVKLYAGTFDPLDSRYATIKEKKFLDRQLFSCHLTDYDLIRHIVYEEVDDSFATEPLVLGGGSVLKLEGGSLGFIDGMGADTGGVTIDLLTRCLEKSAIPTSAVKGEMCLGRKSLDAKKWLAEKGYIDAQPLGYGVTKYTEKKI